jgi:hypothetical protein
VITFPQKPLWSILWNGEHVEGPSATDVLAILGERSYSPMDHKYPKRGIAYRVFVQYQILIDDELPDEMFLTALAEHGVISLSVSGHRPPDVLKESLRFVESWYGDEK